MLGVVPQESPCTRAVGRENLKFFGRLYGLRGADLRDARRSGAGPRRSADRAPEPVERYPAGCSAGSTLRRGVLHGPRVVLWTSRRWASIRRPASASSTWSERAGRRCGRPLHDALPRRSRAALRPRRDHRPRRAAGRGHARRAAARGGRTRDRGPQGPVRRTARGAGAAGHGRELIKVTDTELLLSCRAPNGSCRRSSRPWRAGGDIREGAIEQPSLESLFIKLTGRELRE